MATTQAARRGRADTDQRILDSAEQLVQRRGYNAFSYADIAAELGITKASLHYHFAGKAELGEAVIARYTAWFAEALETIAESSGDASARLSAYVDLYVDVLRGRRLCLCGMLAAEYTTLPVRMQAAVMTFFEANERWLERTLDDGRRAGTLTFDGPARAAACMLVGGLQGAMLLARARQDVAGFERIAAALVEAVAGAEPSPSDERGRGAMSSATADDLTP
jgi:TetR/AcrR family transcriptional regulator, transcriptional repressor for nem operon